MGTFGTLGIVLTAPSQKDVLQLKISAEMSHQNDQVVGTSFLGRKANAFGCLLKEEKHMKGCLIEVYKCVQCIEKEN